MIYKPMALSLLLFLSLISTLLNGHYSAAEDDRKTYIVYMGDRPKGEVFSSDLHLNMLQKVVGSDIVRESLLHSYKRSFNGFVAKLSAKEAQEMARKEGVVSVFPSQKHKLHTTKSWDFIGFPKQVKRSTVESDIIIGVLDTGIWPESDSFDDKGFGPPPSKWKGTCANFTCNNKIIGAKYYNSEGFSDDVEKIFRSPRDSNGHGTHTASTAAGNLVRDANFLGLASGTARGGVPSARLAIYKVCWDFCAEADVLAAFDDAIADGVDIISISIGPTRQGQLRLRDYFQSASAIGAFHAMRHGILTSASAGNNGPGLTSIGNFSPWSLSVAASTIDREFFTRVRLGNGKIYQGTSVNTFDLKDQLFPMIYGGDAPNTSAGYSSSTSRYCFEGSLDKNLVKGKVVFCDGFTSDIISGAIGVVMPHRAAGAVATILPLPASSLHLEDSAEVSIYINSASEPIATISKSVEGPNKLAPYIASFSSRGPNPVTPSILKPDIAAPGVNILAAWPPYAPPTEGDNRRVAYNIISGTSMACPHASAAAAYVKSFNPTWSPAAIKSSLMTTANPMNADLNHEAEFAYGAGQLNPLKAAFPGLVYDVVEADYVNFLCGHGYTTKLLRIVTGNNKSSCPKTSTNNKTALDLNYPAFVLSASPLDSINHDFKRTVTNVGSPNSTYKANLVTPRGLKVKVNPSVLSFTYLGEKQSYAVTVQGTMDKKLVVSASLVWDDGTYQVRSPIVVYVAT